MSHINHSVFFSDNQFRFDAFITDKTDWNEQKVAARMTIDTGNASISNELNESNARALIVALEQHIENISQVRNEFIAIQQIQKKEATA